MIAPGVICFSKLLHPGHRGSQVKTGNSTKKTVESGRFVSESIDSASAVTDVLVQSCSPAGPEAPWQAGTHATYRRAGQGLLTQSPFHVVQQRLYLYG